jgi:predicted RNA-binding Zn-ribbon protein involved in translation (DUF1610 family)
MTEKQIQIIKDLQTFSVTYNRTPTKSDFSTKTTIVRHFGTWNNALLAAGLSPNITFGETQIFNCNKCGITIRRQASQIKGEVYCSRACAVSINNQKRTTIKYRSRKPNSFCSSCNIQIKRDRKWCPDCSPLRNESMPISDLFDDKRAASKYAKIRQRARSKYLANRPYECIICKYTLHIEVAHIHSIASFPKETLVSVVNDLSNLAGLCKRCHWEYDNGYIQLQ